MILRRSARAVTHASLLCSAAALVQAGPAYAQSTDADAQEQSVELERQSAAEEIVVTGSRIARRDLTSTSPMAVIADEEFRLSGAVNVEQVINTLPQVVPGATGFDNNPGGGVATLDLRGLGDERTLVLVNGRRWIFFDTAQLVDLNTIPQFLIDSIDVVTGGASAVYGSDALAGVVNFRLRQDLNGFEAGGSMAITERGDGRRLNAFVAMGAELEGGRGNVTAYAEYFKRGSIYQGDREFSRFALDDADDGTLVRGGVATTPQGRVTVAGTSVVPGLNLNPCTGTNGACLPGQDNDFSDPGEIAARSFARGAGNFGTALGANFGTPGVSDPFDDPQDLYNFAPSNYLMVPQERFLTGAYASYDISSSATAFLEAGFVNNRVANELAPTPVTGTFELTLSGVSPYLSAADLAALQQIDANETAINAERAVRRSACVAAGRPAAECNAFNPLFGTAAAPGVVQVGVSRRIVETGSRNTLDERNAFRILGGLKGPLSADINYEAYYSFARTRNSNIQSGNISRSAFERAIERAVNPINIFGAGTLSQADVDSISILAQNSDISQLQVASASISGSPWNLGLGGDNLGFALGVEWRSMSSSFIPDTALGSGDVIGFNAGQPTAGSYDVKEVFGEVRLPLLGAQPFAHRLELTAAARYSDYSLSGVGGVWTYAAGAEYAPVRDLTLRAQYQKAVRAPNVTELFGGAGNGFPTAVDPCSSRQPASARTEAVRRLCILTGVPEDLVFTPGVQPNTQIEARFSGNDDLKEETARTLTVGAVFRPTFMPRLNVTLDYYDITVDDYIAPFGGGLNNTLNLCYNQIQDIESPYCAVIRRDPANGQIGGQFLPLIDSANVAKLETSGIDLQVDYSIPMGFSAMGKGASKLSLFFLGTYTQKYDFTPVADFPDVVLECAGRFGQICPGGQPISKYKWTSRLSWMDGPLTTSVRWRHLSSVRDDDDTVDYVVERLSAVDYFDASVAFDINDNLSLAMGVNNLFDKQPQLIGDQQEQANTFPNVYDVIGRDYFVSAKLRF